MNKLWIFWDVTEMGDMYIVDAPSLADARRVVIRDYQAGDESVNPKILVLDNVASFDLDGTPIRWNPYVE